LQVLAFDFKLNFGGDGGTVGDFAGGVDVDTAPGDEAAVSVEVSGACSCIHLGDEGLDLAAVAQGDGLSNEPENVGGGGLYYIINSKLFNIYLGERPLLGSKLFY
jgi:hypothetical protein